MSTLKLENIQHPDSSTPAITLDSTGAMSGAIPAGGRNRIINGGFDVWQRGDSINLTGALYSSDRWYITYNSTPTGTISKQTFSSGESPDSEYEQKNYLRINFTSVNSMTSFYFGQKIEDVRTCAGKTVTVSFWAKSNSTRSINANITQVFGSGGSSNIGTYLGQFQLTTSWQKFSQTITVPSIVGKTIGSNSYLHLFFYNDDVVSNGSQYDFWGVQLEESPSATPFEHRSYGDELARCQRFFVGLDSPSAFTTFGIGNTVSSTRSFISIPLVVEMRDVPSSVIVNNVSNFRLEMVGSYAANLSSFTYNGKSGVSSRTSIGIDCTHASYGVTTSHDFTRLVANNNNSALMFISAEL